MLKNQGIPKVIHYCWFGGKPLPELAQKCIASWKKYCPDYEIKEWNENNFDLDCCDYVREAYEAKKWAFVSDYARFWILYREGGIYFDTDVEIVKSIDDILERGAFWGCEKDKMVAPGLGMAAVPGLDIYQEILGEYAKRHFRRENGTLDMTTIVRFVSGILTEHGWKAEAGIQEVCGITVYPDDYFCPMDYRTGELRLTENTRTIHHYAASWYGQTDMKIDEINKKCIKRFGIKTGRIISGILVIPYRLRRKLEYLGILKNNQERDARV